MKKIINAVLIAVVAMTLSGCWESEIGGGKNKSATEKEAQVARDPVTAEQLYGAVVHRGVLAPSNKVKVFGHDMTSDLSMVNLVMQGTQTEPGTMILLVCDRRTKTWAIANNIYQDNGRDTSAATEISIMNYKKGFTEIREADDALTPFFSTAEGETDILGALKKLDKLDQDSTIVFTVEQVGDDGYSHTIGWSPMFTVRDVVKGLRSADLSACANTTPDPNQFLAFLSNEEIRASVGK